MMSKVFIGPDCWFDRDIEPRITKGSIVEFGIDPGSGVAFPSFDVTMIVTELYVDREVDGVMVKVAITPNTNPDYVEEQIIPIEYLELVQE